jgi:hypothetical protein
MAVLSVLVSCGIFLNAVIYRVEVLRGLPNVVIISKELVPLLLLSVARWYRGTSIRHFVAWHSDVGFALAP